LIVAARQIDPNDPASVILYGDMSAPVEIREGSTVGVEMHVTSLGTQGFPLSLDAYLLGGDAIFNWEPLGSPALLFSASAVGQCRSVRDMFGFSTISTPPTGHHPWAATSSSRRQFVLDPRS